MEKLDRSAVGLSGAPTPRILQFGEGNFLRAFADYIIEIYNREQDGDLGILVVKPTDWGDYQSLRDQDGLYHVLIKGLRNGRLIDEVVRINCVTGILNPYIEWEAYLESAHLPDIRIIISNTTEIGICYSDENTDPEDPHNEFPAKLTRWLYQRYRFFRGDDASGCIILPLELIEKNGDKLKEAVLAYAGLWQLEDSFKRWIEHSNTFCNTLVDRIVPGVDQSMLAEVWEQIGYEDSWVTQGEPYLLWAIEPKEVQPEIPFDRVHPNVIFTDDIDPYRERKVRILNGAHTAMVPVGLMYGLNTVREVLEDDHSLRFIKTLIYGEIIPTLTLPEQELTKFADEVLDRFRNPFIDHYLSSIALNSISKFRHRLLPSMLKYREQHNKWPVGIVFTFASLIRFYRGSWRNQIFNLKDDPEILDHFKAFWKAYESGEIDMEGLLAEILGKEQYWGENLANHRDLMRQMSHFLRQIEDKGMEAGLKSIPPA